MASTITTSVVTGGTNSHATSSAEVNALATDVMSQGVVGSFTANTGSGGTGSFCVNAQGTPAMFVDVKAGQAWITATPSGQASQKLRASMTADYTSYAISSNSSGSTKYDWIYLKIDPTAANNPASDASDVASLYTSRSSSNSTDNGTPPTYGKLLAIVTVANGASSITNSNITDKRVRALPHGGINDSNDNEEIKVVATASAVNEITVTNAATGNNPSIGASGDDTNIGLNLTTKGAGVLQINGTQVGASAFKNPYKFSVYRNTALTSSTTPTAIAFDAKSFDTGTNVDVVTNKGRFTAPVAGFYYFTARAGLTAALNTLIQISLYVNGSASLKGVSVDPSQVSSENSVIVSGLLSLSANDYVEAYFVGGGGSTMSTGASVCYFQGFLVSAT